MSNVIAARKTLKKIVSSVNRLRRLLAHRWQKNVTSLLVAMLIALMGQAQAQASTPLLGNPIQLSDSFFLGPSFEEDFLISPDATHVVYREQRSNGAIELYSVPVNGGQKQRLDKDLPAGGSTINRVIISPDSSRVIYQADELTAGVSEIFSVPITGGPSTRLNGNLVNGGQVFSFEVSPDSSHLVYTADQNTDGVTEIFSVPITGGAVTPLNTNFNSFSDVRAFQISANSTHVVYRADQFISNKFELFSVSIAGGEPNRLNTNLFNDGGTIFPEFEISPNSSYVVFRAAPTGSFAGQLFSVTIQGNSPELLSRPLGNPEGRTSNFVIAPNGAHVVYLGDYMTSRLRELFSVPITAGTPVRLNADLTGIEDEVDDGYLISADSTRVVFGANQVFGGFATLYSAALAGNDLQQLLPAPEITNSAARIEDDEFQISADSSTVVYRLRNISPSIDGIVSVPINGGSSKRLTPDAVDVVSLSEFLIAPNCARVFFTAVEEGSNVFGRELFTTPLNKQQVVRVNEAELSEFRAISDFKSSSDSRHIVYSAFGSNGVNTELFSVAIPSLNVENGEFCLPIRANNGRIAVICL